MACFIGTEGPELGLLNPTLTRCFQPQAVQYPWVVVSRGPWRGDEAEVTLDLAQEGTHVASSPMGGTIYWRGSESPVRRPKDSASATGIWCLGICGSWGDVWSPFSLKPKKADRGCRKNVLSFLTKVRRMLERPGTSKRDCIQLFQKGVDSKSCWP